MKKKKLLTLTGILMASLILLIFQGSNSGFHKCSRNSDCPGSLMCLLGPDGFLVCREPGMGETGGPIPDDRLGCLNAHGNWNMASVLKNSGFEKNVPCTVSGEISVFGIVIKGAYTKGFSYSISWTSYACEPVNDNCCIKQGLFSGKDPI